MGWPGLIFYGASPFEWVVTYDADQMFQLGLNNYDLQNAISSYLDDQDLGLVSSTDESMVSSLKQLPLTLTYRTSDKVEWEKNPCKKS